MKHCPNMKSQEKGSGQAQSSGSSDAAKKNLFYALRYMGMQEISPDVVSGLLEIFTLDVNALLDPVLLCPLLHH